MNENMTEAELRALQAARAELTKSIGDAEAALKILDGVLIGEQKEVSHLDVETNE